MLVLTRKLGEGLILNNDINVKILEIKKNQVKIGIDAPDDVRIYRKEIYELVKHENVGAVEAGKNDVKALAGKFRRVVRPKSG